VERSQELADIPAIAEFVPGYETSAWYSIGVPKSTPAEIIDEFNAEVNVGLADPTMTARLVANSTGQRLGSLACSAPKAPKIRDFRWRRKTVLAQDCVEDSNLQPCDYVGANLQPSDYEARQGASLSAQLTCPGDTPCGAHDRL
jgi:hypothetical protein